MKNIEAISILDKGQSKHATILIKTIMTKLIIILLLSPLFSMAQPTMFINNDSAKVKINVSIQARDAEYIGSFMSSGFYRADYDELFDQLKTKMRIANPPVSQTLVAVDSIPIRTWLSIMQQIKTDYIAVQGGLSTRLDAILKAKNNAYMTRILNLANTRDIEAYINNRRQGRINIRRSEN